MPESSLRPPVGLGRAGRRFWGAALEAYEFSPPELELLRQACVVIDQLERADKTLRHSPDLTAEGSMGQVRVHPLVGAANELRKTLSLLLRDLAVPMPGEEEGRRRSPQQAAAARARWDRRTGA